MNFYVDGLRVNDNSLISDIWTNFSLPLYFGHHNLSWEFVTTYYYNEQEIGARIRFNIEDVGFLFLLGELK
jgi:hypothetical protein